MQGQGGNQGLRLLEELDGGGDSWVEVHPGGIHGFDESDLLGSGPVLELFFSGDRVADVGEVFEVDKTVDRVAGSVGAGDALTVGCTAPEKTVGDPEVEIARPTGQDVDPEMIVARRHGQRVAETLGMVEKSRST